MHRRRGVAGERRVRHLGLGFEDVNVRLVPRWVETRQRTCVVALAGVCLGIRIRAGIAYAAFEAALASHMSTRGPTTARARQDLPDMAVPRYTWSCRSDTPHMLSGQRELLLNKE